MVAFRTSRIGKSVFNASALVVACAAFVITAPSAHAMVPEQEPPALERIDKTLEAFGETYQMLDEFKDADAALAYFKETYPEFLDRARKDGLPELSVENATDYKQYAQSQETSMDVSEWNGVLGFLDIFENPVENRTIRQEVELREDSVDAGAREKSEAKAEAELFLPMTNASDLPEIMPLNSGINLQAARNYAAKYAVKYNTKYGYERSKIFLEADCTNFASQILYAGGVKMVNSSSQASGWWWKAKGNRSISWIQANTFARYMGKGYSTKKWKSFVDNVRSGDLIAYDDGDDGSIDHIGFVYNTSAAAIQIAQHSTDYLKWSNNTGWPGKEAQGARYYRIRR